MSHKTNISLLIALLILLLTIVAYSQHVFEQPELILSDAQAKLLRKNKVVSPQIKVILVDEASLKYMNNIAGRWPWPRAVWGDLLDYLSLGGARAVLFDVLFVEQDLSNKANDKALFAATKEAKNVYHSMLISRESSDANNHEVMLPLPEKFVSRFSLRNVTGSLDTKPGTENNTYALPLAMLSGVSKGVAVVEFKPDSDSVLRRTQPLREYQGQYFPVLGLAAFMDSNTPILIGESSIKINDRSLPLDPEGAAIINMYGIDNIESYSMSGIFQSLQKIRQGNVEDLLISPEIFKGSIVFIGSSAMGVGDLKVIPMGKGVPGVYLHAFQASNYLQNDFMTPPLKQLTYLSMFAGVFLTVWAVMFSKRLLFRIVLPLSMLVSYISFALMSYKFNMQVELIPIIFATLAASFTSFVYFTFTEGAEKRKVSLLFAQYVSKDVLHEVMNNYREYLTSSVGKKAEITVLFSDIRGFTTMSETTEPEKIVEMLNIHFTVMADIILKHNGTIDKYIGDAIMAYWGAPVKTDTHAEQAVLAGIEMLEGVKEVNRILKERGFKHEINIGIGVNTGVATVGNIGSDKKKNYTVVGDAVNLSARIESITKEQKTPLLFSEFTYQRIKDKIPCKHIGNVTVKGRGQAVDIYTHGQ